MDIFEKCFLERIVDGLAACWGEEGWYADWWAQEDSIYILIPAMVDMMTYQAHDYRQRDFGDVTWVCISSQDYVTKNHQLDGLKQQKSPKSKCQQGHALSPSFWHHWQSSASVGLCQHNFSLCLCHHMAVFPLCSCLHVAFSSCVSY